MRRIGELVALSALLWMLPIAARAETEFSQTADRDEVGLDDTFVLTVSLEDAPEGSQIAFPTGTDFETLGRSQSSQRSFQFGGGQSGIRHTEQYQLVMRALKPGKLTVPSSVLKLPKGATLKTAPVTLTVKPGSLGPGRASAGRGRGARGMPPMPGFDDPLEELFQLPDERIPRSDSDLFLRAYLDKENAVVGEQVTYSLYIFARVDLSSVDQVTLPKMDGFWAEDIDSPTQLSGEQRMLDGVPYRAYLLKRRALFPDKAGSVEIPTATAEITTGFLFSGRRLRRESNALRLKVAAAPAGAPADFRPEQVGEWKLSMEATPTEVELGQPVTVKVTLEGKGNLKRLALPKLSSTAGLKAYDPTHTDALNTRGGRVGGKRAEEYLVMPQRTGTFALPALRFAFFNPKVGRYQVTEAPGLQLTVKPGPNAPPESAGGPTVAGPQTKNVLAAGALRPLRTEAKFEGARPSPLRRPFMLGLGLAPFGAFLAARFATRARKPTGEDAASQQRRKVRATRERLARARTLAKGPAEPFYAELERAVMSAIELRVGAPVGGLGRPQLIERMGQAGYSEKQRGMLIALLEASESARYAPGLESTSGKSREDWLEQARQLIAGAGGEA